MEYSLFKLSLVLCICVVLFGVSSAKEQEQLEDLKEEIVVPVELVEAGETSQDAVEGSGDSGRKVRQYFGAPPFFGYGGGFGGGFGGGYQRTKVVTRTRVRSRYYGGGFGGFGGGYYG